MNIMKGHIDWLGFCTKSMLQVVTTCIHMRANTDLVQPLSSSQKSSAALSKVLCLADKPTSPLSAVLKLTDLD